jgi:hypothetical protein
MITDGVWEYEYRLKIGIVPFISRTTIVRLPDGGLWVHSPGSLTEDALAELKALGRVSAIVAPNQFHHLFVQEFAEAVNPAPLFAAPGLAAKRPDLVISETLSDEPSAQWQDTFEQLHVRGMPKFEEVIFLHKASRSLIVTDLVFNLGREMPFRTQLVTRMFGTYGRLAISRLFRSFIKDQVAFDRSIKRLADWEFDRVIMAHGDVLETDATERIRRVLALTPPIRE